MSVVLVQILREYLQLAWIFALFLAIEWAFPRERHSWLSRLRGAVFWMIYVPVSVLAGVGFWKLWRELGLRPLTVLDLRHLPLPWLTGPLAALFLADLTYYWMHRALHRFFWRIHAVHHAIEELNGVSCYSHWMEGLFRVVFMTLPAALLVTQVDTIVGIGTLMTLHGSFLHSSGQLNMGPLRWLIADNRFHRIHHSIEPAHFNKNFAATTPLWDWLFGTAYFPKRQEWPATGLADQPEVASISDYLTRPFRAPPAAAHLPAE